MSIISEKLKELRIQNGLTLLEVAKYLGVQEATVQRYESGKIKNIKHETICKLAELYHCDPSFIMGWEEQSALNIHKYTNIFPIEKKKIPLLGEIACGKPMYADEDRESYVVSGTDINADFCLRAHGDSMIGARIYDGDIVFIRQQDIVNNGEIAAVIIGDEATLKRVYYYPEKGKLVLNAENPKYEPLVYIGSELEEIHILGKAVAFQSDVI